VVSSPDNCFHCGIAVSDDADYPVTVNGATQLTCCPGCQAVVNSIQSAGLAAFYRQREQPAGSPVSSREQSDAFHAWDHAPVQRPFVHDLGEGRREVHLLLEGIVCGACAWLNEENLARQPGVTEAQVNYATHRARVVWDPEVLSLGQLLEAVARVGYQAHPYDPSREEVLLETQRRQQLRRLGVSGVLMAQVMMLALALYAGDWWGIDPALRGLLRWCSLLLCLPVVVFGGRPFFAGAFQALRHRRVGMDVPITLGIGLAFGASTLATWEGRGAVYFDSVAMFIFLLLAVRFMEFSARRRSSLAAEPMVRAVPAMCLRYPQGDTDATPETVAVAELGAGDRCLVRPGEVIPADGEIREGRSSVDESLITGESRPLPRVEGDSVMAGSINADSPVVIHVSAAGPDTVLAHLWRMVERARADKPAVARLADRVAAGFLFALLLLAGVVAIYWWRNSPEDWLPITVSLLVVTCPCALSLAIPAALAAATGNLARSGLVVTRGHVLETLAKVTDVVLDKTGTLTFGRPRLVGTRALTPQRSREDCLRVAAGLAQSSEHPMARALREALRETRGESAPPPATGVISTPGGGLEGSVGDNDWVLGSPQFVAERTGIHEPQEAVVGSTDSGSRVLLADNVAVRAVFLLHDELRPGAADMTAFLRRSGKRVHLWSGDGEAPVRQAAAAVGIQQAHWDMGPDDKLQRVRSLQNQGAVVAMVGDGINDAPVLSASAVSIAMSSGAQLARANADVIVLGNGPKGIVQLFRLARRTRRTMVQNLSWALGYNLLAVPAAAAGLLMPWMAALGMALSSAVVVADALRLGRYGSGG